LHRYWQKYPERYFRDILQSQKQITGQAFFFLTHLQFQNCEFIYGNQKCLLQIPQISTIILTLNKKTDARKASCSNHIYFHKSANTSITSQATCGSHYVSLVRCVGFPSISMTSWTELLTSIPKLHSPPHSLIHTHVQFK